MSEKPKFWKPEPKPLHLDIRMWCLLLPLIVESVGFVLQGLFTFALNDIQIVGPVVQSWIVVVGGGCLVFGSEMGTIATGVEVYRRKREGTAVRLDDIAMWTSCAATLANIIISLASRVAVGYDWGVIVLEWGPLFLGAAVVADYIGGIIELSAMDADYNARVATWRDEFESWQQKSKVALPESKTLRGELEQLRGEFDALPKPHARKNDYLAWWRTLNGEAQSIETWQDARLKFEKTGWQTNPKSASDWFKELKK